MVVHLQSNGGRLRKYLVTKLCDVTLTNSPAIEENHDQNIVNDTLTKKCLTQLDGIKTSI